MTHRTELPLPTPAFRLGVVGNRSLQGTDVEALAATTGNFLANLSSAISASITSLAEGTSPAAYAPGPPRLFLMNSLAEGADQLVADVALARKERYRVRCPIPFTSEIYKGFFTYDRDASIERFDRITRAPENDPIIVELSCPPDVTERSDGYAAAADILLDNSDLLFAIYDFSRAGSEGGTAETVRKALGAGVSVIAVDARDPDKLVLLRTGGENRALTPHLLNQIVKCILLPPGSTALARFLREPLTTGNQLTKTALRLLGAAYGAFWSLIPWVGAIHSSARPSAPSVALNAAPSEESPAQKRIIDEVQRPYRGRMARVDTLAAFYMDLYRGSFVMNFLFGALAVLFGLLSYFNYEHASSWLRCEAIALGIIFTNFIASRVWDWRGRALDYRFIAEHLRQMMMLAPLGRSAPLVRPAPHYHGYDPTDTWMRWYILALDRDQGLIDFDAPAAPAVLRMNDAFVNAMRSQLCDEWLVGQYRYYQRTESRFKGAMAVFRALMLLLFVVTAAGVAAHFMHISVALDTESWREDSVLIIIIAGLPAFLGALHGIAVQGELEIIAERASAMSAHLAKIIEEMTRAALAGNTSAIELSRQAVRAAHMMLGETLDWRIIHQAHEVELT